MARHHNTRPRCPRCQLHFAHCICSKLPDIQCPIPVVVVQHWKESKKPTSTGSLLANILSGASRRFHGHRDVPFDGTGLDLPNTWLVFPVRDGTEAVPEHPPAQLVLVDGNWNQASRMARRIPAIARLPRLTLRSPVRPVSRLREPPAPGARSTMEAAAAALELSGHPEVARKLERAHDLFVATTLFQRGIRTGTLSPVLPTPRER